MMDTTTSLSTSTPSQQNLLIPSTSRPNLVDFSIELQERSMRLLDRSSLLSLARVTSCINRNAQPTLFRHINFFVTPKDPKPPSYRLPRIASKYSVDLVSFATYMFEVFGRKDLTTAHLSETQDSMKMEIDSMELERQRYGWVRSVKIVSHPVLNQANIALLNCTSSSLTNLTIEAAHNFGHGHEKRMTAEGIPLGMRLSRDYRHFHPPSPVPPIAIESPPSSPSSQASSYASTLPEFELSPLRTSDPGSDVGFEDLAEWEGESVPINLNLSVLTHLTLGKNSIRFVEFLPLIFRIAPNLIQLSADMSNERSSDPHSDFDITLASETKLRNLSIRYTEHRDAANSQSFDILLDFLGKSPHISTLSLDYSINKSNDISDYFKEFEDKTLGQIAQLSSLVELNWQVKLKQKDYDRLRYIDFSSYQNLRKLIVKYHLWSYPCKLRVPTGIEHLGLDCTDRQDYKDWPLPPVSLLPSYGALDPTFAAWLRNTPHLHTISYLSEPAVEQVYPQGRHNDGVYWDSDDTDSEDGGSENGEESQAGGNEEDVPPSPDDTLTNPSSDIHSDNQSSIHNDEVSNQISIRIFSIRHGTHELLFGRQYAHDIKIYHDFGRQTGSMLCCHGEKRVEDRHSSVIQQPPTWRYFGDWDGMAIPFRILEKMRVNENRSMGEWEQRGVDVSEETWAMTRQWRAGIVTAKKVYDGYLNGEG